MLPTTIDDTIDTQERNSLPTGWFLLAFLLVCLLLLLQFTLINAALAAESSGVVITRLTRELSDEVKAASATMENYAPEHEVLNQELKEAASEYKNAETDEDRIRAHARIISAKTALNKAEREMADGAIGMFERTMGKIYALRDAVNGLKTGGMGDEHAYRAVQIQFSHAMCNFANILDDLSYVSAINPDQIEQLRQSILTQSQINQEIAKSTSTLSTDSILANLDSLELQAANIISARQLLDIEMTELQSEAAMAVTNLVAMYVGGMSDSPVITQASQKVLEGVRERRAISNRPGSASGGLAPNGNVRSVAETSDYKRLKAGANIIKE